MSKSEKTKEIWNKLATWWDSEYQEGDVYHQAFLFPTLTKWVQADKSKTILDIGCGNGALARIFAKLGAKVVATDFSDVFIQKAKERSDNLSIDFRLVDATDESQLQSLKVFDGYDYIVSNMVLHDMPTLLPLASSLKHLLKPNGIFIFSVPHPCFNSGMVAFEDLQENSREKKVLLSNNYIRSQSFEIFSKPGQPVKQMCFHRPLSELFNTFFKNGFVLDGFVEPTVDPKTLPENFLWGELSEIPPAIICRFRRDK